MDLAVNRPVQPSSGDGEPTVLDASVVFSHPRPVIVTFLPGSLR